MRIREDAHGSSHVQVPAFGLRATLTLIDENSIGSQQLGQRQFYRVWSTSTTSINTR